MIRSLILAGYFELTMYLQVSGKLGQCINTHYAYLTYISMVLSFLLAVTQLVIWMKNLKLHSHLHGKTAKLTSPMILVIPVLAGLLVPTVTLGSTTVVAKDYNFPLVAGSAGTINDGRTTVRYLKPDISLYFTPSVYEKKMQKEFKKYKGSSELKITTENYMEVMELIYLYPDEFMGYEITYTGFVCNEPGREDYRFLFRFGIIHRIADSSVYGLLTTRNSTSCADDTQIATTDAVSLEYSQTSGQTLPILHIAEMKGASEPDNPYVYRIF